MLFYVICLPNVSQYVLHINSSMQIYLIYNNFAGGMKENLITFVKEHADDNCDKLLLGSSKWPEIDIKAAVNCIISRRKLKNKMPLWYECERLLYPNTISAEQCSGQFTASYKASLARGAKSIADLTGGLGVDSWAFAGTGAKLLYNEMNPEIFECTSHNFKELGVSAICRNFELRHDNLEEILDGFSPELIFLDPARRSESGGKVFRLEDCQPNILKLCTPLLEASPRILVKISPMADISLVCRQISESCSNASVESVHILGSDGECKELILDIRRKEREKQDFRIIVAHADASLEFSSLDESNAKTELPDNPEAIKDMLLFEPEKVLSKSGAYKLLCSYGLIKAGHSTHLYFIPKTVFSELTEKDSPLIKLGKIFNISEILPLNKQNMKVAGRAWPKSEVTARNIPLSSDELRKRLGVRSGNDAHIFGIHCDFKNARSDNYLLICSKSY